MKGLWSWIQVAMTALGGFLGWFLGGMDGFMFTLIAFVALDYVTGVFCAVVDKRLSSNIGFKGIFRKILIFVMVGVGHMIDTYIIGDGGVLRTAIIFFYLSNEGISMLENAGHLGLPIPQKLMDVLSQLRQKNDKNDEKSE